MRDNKMTANFLRSEFACKGHNCCGGSAPIQMPLVLLLQAVRDRIRMPLTVTSGFRCIAHNNTISGAVPDSYHTQGIAADVTTRLSVAELYTAVQAAIAEAGYGYAIPYVQNGFVHIDIRNYW